MSTEDLTLCIQAAAVVVAVGAAVAALFISWRDRVTTRHIAEKDRQVSLQQAKLLFDLNALTRLLENENYGGSTDPLVKERLGAKELTLVGLIGPDLLPTLWARKVELPEEGLRALLKDPTTPEWKRDAIEVQLAVNTVQRETRTLTDSQ